LPTSGKHSITSVEFRRKTSSPPGLRRREASGIQRYGSAQIEAPYSETTRSKDASGSGTASPGPGTSGKRQIELRLHPPGRVELRRRRVDADRARAAPASRAEK